MAENVKSMVSLNSNKEVSDRWKYRYNFCREIGVKFLYGDKLSKVSESELLIMLGACIEHSANPFVVVMSIMRLIIALTKESFLDRPFYSIRQRMRRTSAKCILVRVLYYLVLAYADDHDECVRAVMDLLTAREEAPILGLNKPKREDFFPHVSKPDVVSTDESQNDDCGWIADDEASLELKINDSEEDENPVHSNAEEPVHSTPEDIENWFINQPWMRMGEVFLDAAALKEYQNKVITGDNEQREHLQSQEYILPGPSFSDIDAMDPLAWADTVREYFGLNIKVKYVAPNELPWLATTMSQSGLSKRDYYIVKYAVYCSQRNPALVVECAAPGVMELYQFEMSLLRSR